MRTIPFLIISSFFLFLSGNVFSQTADKAFFNQADQFFSQYVKNGQVHYGALKNNSDLEQIVQSVEQADLSMLSETAKKAFLINAYNIHVIQLAVEAYPIQSVNEVAGFFDRKKIVVAGESLTLSKLENERLLKVYQDARLHFVLVCGAVDCPPITGFAYRPEKLDQQLDQQTRAAVNNLEFIRISESETQLSQIFKWYATDFGGNKNAILEFINRYRVEPIKSSTKVSYYNYDWSLNDSGASVKTEKTPGANASRYVVSSTINKGSIEVKIFNNLYTQRTGSEGNLTDRSTFYTTLVTGLYGVSNRLNVGFTGRYRRVRNDQLPSSPLGVFGNNTGDGVSNRQGITAFGPQIRYRPFDKWKNFSIQSSFEFAIGDDLTGNETQPFIDWDGATWITQFFNDFPIGNNFSFFTELDFIWEDFGSSANGRINRISTPATFIFSYNPNKKITVYGLSGFSPFWQSDFDYFFQFGVGAKYQFTPKFELELLYTDFNNRFLIETGGQAATYNLGIRFNL